MQRERTLPSHLSNATTRDDSRHVMGRHRMTWMWNAGVRCTWSRSHVTWPSLSPRSSPSATPLAPSAPPPPPPPRQNPLLPRPRLEQEGVRCRGEMPPSSSAAAVQVCVRLWRRACHSRRQHCRLWMQCSRFQRQGCYL
eukprot:287938-Rhodomonas_salina.2